MVVPIASSFDLEDLKRCVAAERADIDLDSAVMRAGAQNVVIETDELIVRFPRSEAMSVEWEAQLLRLVHGSTSFATPEVLWLGTATRCLAYRKITGIQFDRIAYVAQSEPARDAFANRVARSLVEVQAALALAVDSGADLPVDNLTTFYAPLRDRLSEFPADARPAMSDLLDEYEDTFLKHRAPVSVAMHNDFHFGNMVLDGPLGSVVGLWDFSCAALGVAAWDLRYFEGDLASPWEEPVHAPGEHLDLLNRVVLAYGDLRGTSVDPRACVVANRVEALCDLWIDGARDALRAWSDWDTDSSS